MKKIDNLAHKIYVIPEVEERIEEQVVPSKYAAEKVKKRRVAAIKRFMLATSYAIIFLVFGTIYLDCVIAKTKYNIKREKLKEDYKSIVTEIKDMKAATDAKVEKMKIKNYSMQKFDMVDASEGITYVQFK